MWTSVRYLLPGIEEWYQNKPCSSPRWLWSPWRLWNTRTLQAGNWSGLCSSLLDGHVTHPPSHAPLDLSLNTSFFTCLYTSLDSSSCRSIPDPWDEYHRWRVKLSGGPWSTFLDIQRCSSPLAAPSRWPKMVVVKPCWVPLRERSGTGFWKKHHVCDSYWSMGFSLLKRDIPEEHDLCG